MNSRDPQTEYSERLNSWVREYGRSVFGYVTAMTGRPDQAEDLVQEVFRRVWQARERYQEKGEARAYLFRIADRLVRDWRRRQGRETTLSDQAWAMAEPPGENTSVEQNMANQEDRARLTTAMRQLSDAQRRVLLMRYYGSLEFAQIAQIMDSPINTILSHCRRGLIALKKLLAEEIS